MHHVRTQLFLAFLVSLFAVASPAAVNVEEGAEWVSTASNYSLTVNSSLFSQTTFQSEAVLRAVSSGASIHSHYTGVEPSSTACEFSGRMFKGVSSSGIGVTFASRYPTSAAYYRLGTSASGGQYVLTPYSSAGKAAPVGNLYSGVTPAVSAWTRFKLRWESRNEAIYIRAKIWADGTPEPASWQIYAEDTDQNRFGGCRVGVWSNNGGGQNYWDQLSVLSLDKIDDHVLSQSDGLEALTYMWSGTILNAGNPLYPNSGSFQHKSNNGNIYVTNTSASLIHSHFIEALPTAHSCSLTGSFKKTKAAAGFGVTFASSYPSSNRYYSLRSNGSGNSFQLTAAPDTKALPSGVTDTGLIPGLSKWYDFKIQWEALADRVRVRGKVWDSATQEPSAWQIDAEDFDASRYSNCRVGLWSNSASGNYWDNLKLEPLQVQQPVNHPPAITSSPLTQINDNQSYSYQVTAADPDGADTLTYTLISAPLGMTISSSGLIEWQPKYADVGVHPVSLRVADHAGLSQQQDFSLTVTHVNTSPTITSIPVTNSSEGELYNYQVLAQDLEGSSIHYSLINGPSSMLIEGTTGLIHWAPSFKDGGIVTVAVRVADAEGAYSEQEFELLVANVNRAPIFISPPHLYAAEGQAYLYFPYVADPDIDPLSYSLTSAPFGMTINPGSGFISWIPSFDAQGQQLVTIVATDSQGATTTQSFVVFVENFNVAPEIDSVPEQLAFEGEEYKYQLAARDLEGQLLSYSLSVAPSGMTISPNSGLITWTPSFESTGAHPVSVMVTDYEGAKNQQNFLILVSEVNREPAFSTEPVAIAIEGRPYNYQVLVSDPDKNDDIRLSLGDAPAGMLLGENDRALVWDNPRAGTYPVSLTLSDRAGSTVEQTFVLHVVPDESSGSAGREFFVAFPPNNVNSNLPQISLAIVSEKSTSGFVHIPELNFFAKFAVTPGQLTSVALPSAVQYLAENAIGNLGIRVVAKDPVTLYGVNHLPASTDAFLAIPSTSLGQDYFVLSYKDGVAPSRFSIVATEDNTTVTIKNSLNATPVTVLLNKYQTYLSNRSLLSDVTGVSVAANKPIGVFGTVQCANIPTKSVACDHVVEMLPPVSTWGQEFYMVPLATRLNGDIVRVLASQDSTEITVNGVFAQTINRGEYYEAGIRVAAKVEVSKPSLVAHYSTGSSTDGLLYADPFMMLVPPAKQYRNKYIVGALDENTGFAKHRDQPFTPNYLNVVVESNSVASLKLDGVAVNSSIFSQIGSSQYSGAQIPVRAGSHSLMADTPFSVSVYGYSFYDSYGYPGGANFDKINVDETMKPDVLTEITDIDQSQCPEKISITANIHNVGRGDIASGLPVDLYLGNPSSGGVLVQRKYTSYSLQEGQYEELSFSFDSIQQVASVYIVADYLGATGESDRNETNNTDMASNINCSEKCPNNLQARIAADGISLDWNGLYEESYVVQRARSLAGPYEQIGIINNAQTQYIDSESFDRAEGVYYRISNSPINDEELACYSNAVAVRLLNVDLDPVTIPDLVGSSESTATTILSGSGLLAGDVIARPSSKVAPGRVIEQDPPAGSLVTYGSEVNYSVSQGAINAPTINAGPKKTITEGDLYTNEVVVGDPDSTRWTATINYGDGTGNETLLLTAEPKFTLGHRYLKDGIYTVKIAVSDGEFTNTASTVVVVTNDTPLFELSETRTHTVGRPINLGPIPFSDKGIMDSHRGIIDWGDGNLEDITLIEASGSGNLWASHDYSATGRYDVSVEIDDLDGGVTKKTMVLTVKPIGFPVFESLPVLQAHENQQYVYDANAVDPDGDTLTYSLQSSLAGITIDTHTGVVSWMPVYGQRGNHPITISADDGLGGRTNQTYTLSVLWDAAIHITQYPIEPVVVNDEIYRFQILAIHPTGQPITFSLENAPLGATIDPSTGLLEWTPTLSQVGRHTFVVRAADGEGLTDSESVTITVNQNTNRPPEIQSDPVRTATINLPYRYQVMAVDPESHRISFGLVQFPSGMTINSSSGLIEWLPVAQQAFDADVHVRVTDERGRSSDQQFTIVTTLNHKPEFKGAIPNQAAVDNLYRVMLPVVDTDGDPLSFSVLSGPTGLGVSASAGEITWTPDASQAGSHEVRIAVSDGKETVWFSWAIQVVETAKPLQVSVVAEPQYIQVDQTTTLTIAVAGGASAVSHKVYVDGVLVNVGAAGKAAITGTTIGRHDIFVEATDGNQTVTNSAYFAVFDPEDSSAPVVELINPTQNQIVTSPLDVIGIVRDESIVDVRLSYRRSDLNAFTDFYRGASLFESASIATFDPTLLANGTYQILLEATDSHGVTTTDSVSVIVEGNLKVGDFTMTVEDLAVPLEGVPIRVTRTYDSKRRNENLAFGYGWSIGYQDVLIEESDEPSKDWSLYYSQREVFFENGMFFSFKAFCPTSSYEKQISVTLPNGEIEKFSVRAKPVSGGAAAYSNPNCYLAPDRYIELVYTPSDDTDSQLESLDGQLYLSDVNNGNLVYLGESTPALISRYKLTTKSGYVYYINQQFGIEKIVYPNNEFITFNRDRIEHSGGKVIAFHRDSRGRIERITGPGGNEVVYVYDEAGDLRFVEDSRLVKTPENDHWEYSYDSKHYLTSINDPLNRPIIKNLYDDAGRLYGQENADGVRKIFDHDVDARTTSVTDFDGRTTIYNYDDRGNVTQEIKVMNDGVYSQDIVTSFTYDEFDNQLTKVVGDQTHIWTKGYDDQRNLAFTLDPEGNRVDYLEYNALGQETRIQDEMKRLTVMEYDDSGRLEKIIMPTVTDVASGNARSSEAVNTYNALGQVESTKDLRDLTTSYTYYPQDHVWAGKKWTETNVETGTTTYTYDLNLNLKSESRRRTVGERLETETVFYDYDSKNRLIKTIYPDGTFTETQYDLAGMPDMERDRFGNWTDYSYDVYGRLVETRFPDGSYEIRQYTNEGLLKSVTDRMGRVTEHQYDDAGRLWKVINSDGTYTETQYSAQGLVRYVWDENRNLTEYEYDLAGRRSSHIRYLDGRAIRTSFTYYPNGELHTETDALGRVTTYEINELNQRVSTLYPNGTLTQSQFDPMGGRTLAIDQNSRATRFELDLHGRLTGVTPQVRINNATVPATLYQYDELGNKTRQIDANGHTTRWTYDYYGRVLSRSLPEGQTERFVYDDTAHAVTHIDFNGISTVTTYDVSDRVSRVEYANGQSENFTYYANGQMHTVNDKHGTTEYGYDARDRMNLVIQPDGTRIDYRYDDVGNRTQVKVTRSIDVTSVDYTYDDLNRLETVTDSNGTTIYTYYDTGSLHTVTYPNGVVTTYSYNVVNQVESITTKDANGASLSGYTYGLDNTGRRETITEVNGRFTDSDYDDLYRLIGETITEPGRESHSATYEYDWVGNRKESAVNGVRTSLSYDGNDRLYAQGSTTYTYDNNGNLRTESQAGILTEYFYDEKDHLDRVEKGGISTSYTYGHTGIRTSKTEGGQTTKYVVDENRDYAQVLQEVSGETVKAQYTYGLDLINQKREGQLSYYQYDGLGSTRALTDASGVLTDQYNYEAFGELLNSNGSTANDYRFAGEQFDSGLNQYYLRARYYDQSVGRFTQLDTWMGAMSRPSSLNKYVYTEGDPVNHVDPSGRFLAAAMSQMNIQAVFATAAVATAGVSLLNSMSYNFTDRDISYRNRVRTGTDVILGTVAANACANANDPDCRASIPLLVLGADMGDHMFHVYDAQRMGYDAVLSRSSSNDGRWYSGLSECDIASRSTGLDCDEYPFNSTHQGGEGNYYSGRVSLRAINASDNRRGGNLLRQMYERCNVTADHPQEAWFGVIAAPTAESRVICPGD